MKYTLVSFAIPRDGVVGVLVSREYAEHFADLIKAAQELGWRYKALTISAVSNTLLAKSCIRDLTHEWDTIITVEIPDDNEDKFVLRSKGVEIHVSAVTVQWTYTTDSGATLVSEAAYHEEVMPC